MNHIMFESFFAKICGAERYSSKIDSLS